MNRCGNSAEKWKLHKRTKQEDEIKKILLSLPVDQKQQKKHEDTAIEIIQSEEKNVKILKKNEESLMTCEMIESQAERRETEKLNEAERQINK